MRVVLATGIYPPDIGGPALYVAGLSDALSKKGHQVTVITYGKMENGKWKIENENVVQVSKSGGVLTRWLRYSKALRKFGKDADAVIVFTSVSVGIPLIVSRLKKPKKFLRLGGDFFWERYTDAGGTKGLKEWYESKGGFWRLMNAFFMEGILRSFDTVVYSTYFQRSIHTSVFKALPAVVIENARPTVTPVSHQLHRPLRLLFMGRFVRFKNIPMLIESMIDLPEATLTIVGDGPLKKELQTHTEKLDLHGRVIFQGPVLGDEKNAVFAAHDVLVIPSVTEISPNVALEAVSQGLPVLLTRETGLQDIPGITIKRLTTPSDISTAVQSLTETYEPPRGGKVRGYDQIADDFLKLII